VINPQSVPEVRSSPGLNVLFFSLAIAIILGVSLGCSYVLWRIEPVKVFVEALIERFGLTLVRASGMAALFIVISALGLLVLFLIAKVTRAPVFRALGRHLMIHW